MAPLRIIFMGTAELACASLEALATQPDFTVAAVVTQPDRPKGRDLKLQSPPVKLAANRLQVPVLQPARAKEEAFIRELSALKPDLIAVAAYGQILPPAILDLPRFGCVNVHTSLLPKYRGAAPIQWAILDDDTETGVTIMKMDPGMDTGDILTQETTPIGPEDDARTLHDRLAGMGAELLLSTVRDFTAGKITPRPQLGEPVYARKITKEDGRMDWKQPARVLWNRVRGLIPWPGAFTQLIAPSPPRLLKVWKAEVADGSGAPGMVLQSGKDGIVVACGQRALKLQELQVEGGRRLRTAEFLSGHAIKPGDKVGSVPARATNSPE